MIPAMEWVGSVENEGGTATFSIEGKTLEMEFASFKEAYLFHVFVYDCYKAGFRDGRKELGVELDNFMKKEGIKP